MTCYGPLAAWRPRKGSGDRRLVFDKRKSETGIKYLIPCGQCAGCRLDTVRQWAIRCMHEKQMHMFSSFITLTYDDKHLPPCGSLSLYDYQCFLKRVRHYFGKMGVEQVRFAGCGEYGDDTKRPHYHILLLNCDFADRKYFKMSSSGLPLYVSKELDKLWSRNGEQLGLCNIGNVDYDSCSYVAGYVMKKLRGGLEKVYFDPDTGEVKEPEFFTMSRRPGLGSSWYEKYGAHSFEWDSVVFKGQECTPPRFYTDKRVGPLINEALKKKRRRKAMLHRVDQTQARLRVREVVALAKLNLKGKSL